MVTAVKCAQGTAQLSTAGVFLRGFVDPNLCMRKGSTKAAQTLPATLEVIQK